MTTTHMRDGTITGDPRLGRIRSARTDHLEKYPLTASTLPQANTSMVMGVNWYASFDTPILRRCNDGNMRYVIGAVPFGPMRGGHAVALRNWNIRDLTSWWRFYNQALEGRCVEFAVLRALTHANRVQYDISSRWLYWMAQRADEWAGGSWPGAQPQYEGTSVRAGLEIARQYGLVRKRLLGRPYTYEEAALKANPKEGIAAYRWAQNWQDVRTVLGVPDWLDGVPVNNSWGQAYPHEVILTDAAGERLLREDGEFGVVTDR